MFIGEPNNELLLHFLICEVFFWLNYCIAFLLLSFLCVYLYLKNKIPADLSNIFFFQIPKQFILISLFFPLGNLFSPLSFTQCSLHLMGSCPSGFPLPGPYVVASLDNTVSFFSVYVHPHFGKEQSLVVF